MNNLSGVLMWCIALIYVVLFVGVNWDGWPPLLLTPPWFAAMGVYAFREPIDSWGEQKS